MHRRYNRSTPLNGYGDWLLCMDHLPSAFLREDAVMIDVPPLAGAVRGLPGGGTAARWTGKLAMRRGS